MGAVSFFVNREESTNLRGMKVIRIISVVLVPGVVLLAVHIFLVTRPKADGHSRGMARIDLHQRIGQADADRIAGWLRRQPGVDRVLVNHGTAIAVFTYRPGAADPGKIVRGVRDSLSFARAERYLPTTAEIRSGCPMRATPVTNKIYEFLHQLF
jgi:hypothetical protein